MSRRQHQHPSAYQWGRDEREASVAKCACPYPYLSPNWAWWLAGWNDKDIEIEAKAERPVTPAPVANQLAA